MYTKIYSRKHARLSDRQNRQMERRMDRHVVGLTEEKTDKQRHIRTKHKQGRHTDYIYCHADIQIYYNERALTALKRYTSKGQAGHFN